MRRVPTALILALLCGIAGAANTGAALQPAAPQEVVGGGLRSAASGSKARHVVEVQLSSQTHKKLRVSSGGTSGFKIHRKRVHLKVWSPPCRKLPLEQRAACERKVDAEVLHDKTWVQLDDGNRMAPAAFTIPLNVSND